VKKNYKSLWCPLDKIWCFKKFIFIHGSPIDYWASKALNQHGNLGLIRLFTNFSTKLSTYFSMFLTLINCFTTLLFCVWQFFENFKNDTLLINFWNHHFTIFFKRCKFENLMVINHLPWCNKIYATKLMSNHYHFWICKYLRSFHCTSILRF
jgi:hypothetical protein